MKATVYIATSLDGFIARPDGGIDWLDDPPEEGGEDSVETQHGGNEDANEPTANGGEDYGFQEFFDTVDYLVMGHW